MHLGEIEKPEFPRNFVFDFLALLHAQPVPFIDRQHQRPARFKNISRDMRILFRDVTLRIQHQHDNIGILHCLHGFDRGNFFDHFMHFAALSQSRRINQGIAFSIAFKIDINAVARRAGLGKHYDPFLADQAVEQC